MGLSDNFSLRHDNAPPAEVAKAAVPLDRRGVIPIQAEYGSRNAINFNYILETGKIPASARPSDKGKNYYVDHKSDDALNRALDQIKKNVWREIEENPELMGIASEVRAGKFESREVWEERIATITQFEMRKIRGLQGYRNNRFEGVERSPRLNDISEDITNGTKKYEFDCEVSSIIAGMVIQQTENHFLGAQAKKLFLCFRCGKRKNKG